MRRMSCPTISSIGLLERKRLFNFFTALHLLLATKDGGQRGSRAACCFFCFLGWISLTWIKLLVVVYVADERAPFSAGRDKAAQNVDIIVQRSVHRQLNRFGKHGIALFTQVVAPPPAPGSLLMRSSRPFSKARQAAFLSVAPALCVSLQDFKTRIIVGMFQLGPRWVKFFLADIDFHLEVGSFDNNSNLAIALDDDGDKEWVLGQSLTMPSPPGGGQN